MSVLFPGFFATNHYFVDEKVGIFKFSNAYKVFDEKGEQIGNIKQEVTGFLKFLRVLASMRQMMPFALTIKDMQDITLVTITRGWTFWMSKIVIKDSSGSVIGFIHQKFKFMKPTFLILDTNKVEIAKITGDWKAWNFDIIDEATLNQMGTITKKWNGFIKETFTTADKYVVSIFPKYAENTRKTAIVATAIIIDMVLKSNR